jgi:hypothetical protein
MPDMNGTRFSGFSISFAMGDFLELVAGFGQQLEGFGSSFFCSGLPSFKSMGIGYCGDGFEEFIAPLFQFAGFVRKLGLCPSARKTASCAKGGRSERLLSRRTGPSRLSLPPAHIQGFAWALPARAMHAYADHLMLDTAMNP